MSNHKLHRDRQILKKCGFFFLRMGIICVYFWFLFFFFFNLFISIIITAVCNHAVTIRCMLSPKYLGLDWTDTFLMVWTVSSSSFGIGAMVLSPPAKTSPHHYARSWKSLEHEVTKRKSKKETFPSLILRDASRLCNTRVHWLYLHVPSAWIVLSLGQSQVSEKVFLKY